MCRLVHSPPKSVVMVVLLWLGSNMMITTLDAFSTPPTSSVVNLKRSVTTTTTTSTSIMMFNFDWFNPKPTAEKKSVEEKEEVKAEEAKDNEENESAAEFIEKGLETSEPPKSGDEIISEIEKELSDDVVVVVDASKNKQVKQVDNEIHSGTVEWFDRQKGFGFIRPNEGSKISKDIFVHQSELQGISGWRYLMQGEPVEYSVVDDPKGYKALKVTGPNGGKLRLEARREEKEASKNDETEASEKK